MQLYQENLLFYEEWLSILECICSFKISYDISFEDCFNREDCFFLEL